MTRLKGPRFPSFDNQRTPKPHKQWLAHSGRKARIRYLRQICHPILSSKDPEYAAAIQRIKDKVTEGPFSEYGILMIVFQAKEVSDSTGVDWIESVQYILDQLKENENGEGSTGISEDDRGSDSRDSGNG